jgi:hypothetical protein
MSIFLYLSSLNAKRFDNPSILKHLSSCSRKLPELKAASILNQGILINTFGLQETRNVSYIENIFTTHHEFFNDGVLPGSFTNSAIKEVLRYRQTLRTRNRIVPDTKMITNSNLMNIQSKFEGNTAWLSKPSGAILKRN